MKSDRWHDSLQGRLPLLPLRDLCTVAFNSFSSSDLCLGVTELQIFCSSLAARGRVAARAGGMGGSFLCLVISDARDCDCKLTSAVEGRVSYASSSSLTCWTLFLCIFLISCRSETFHITHEPVHKLFSIHPAHNKTICVKLVIDLSCYNHNNSSPVILFLLWKLWWNRGLASFQGSPLHRGEPWNETTSGHFCNGWWLLCTPTHSILLFI